MPANCSYKMRTNACMFQWRDALTFTVNSNILAVTATGAPATKTLGNPLVARWAIEVLSMNWTTAPWKAVYQSPVVSASIAHLLTGYNTITGGPSTIANGTPTARVPNFHSAPDISQGWDVLAPQTKSSLCQSGCVHNRSIGERYSPSNCAMHSGSVRIHAHIDESSTHLRMYHFTPLLQHSTHKASSDICSNTQWPVSSWYSTRWWTNT